MALERIDLSGSVCIEDGCTKIIFNDDTGLLVTECNDEQNDLGYGLVDGVAVNDVTSSILNIYYPGLETPFIFTFTVSSGIITAATLTDLNGDDTDILADLESTDFPLVDFDATLAAYGVTFPEIVDGILNWDYTIIGVAGGEAFIYTTSGGQLVDCNISCCIENSYLKLDVNCDCLEDKVKNIQLAEFFLNAAKYAINVGQDSKADGFITKAKEICDNNCETC